MSDQTPDSQTPDLYETYIRTEQGTTYHPTDFRQGIKDFLGNDGYRISFNIEGVVITLRKDTPVGVTLKALDRYLNQDSVACSVSIRGHK